MASVLLAADLDILLLAEGPLFFILEAIVLTGTFLEAFLPFGIGFRLSLKTKIIWIFSIFEF